MSDQVKLKDCFFRKNESKAISHRLVRNSVNEDLTGWTIDLFVDFVLLKTISEATSGATIGLIKDQTGTPGEYYFTLLESDFVDLDPGTYECYIRYNSPATIPPDKFANVIFNLKLLKATQ